MRGLLMSATALVSLFTASPINAQADAPPAEESGVKTFSGYVGGITDYRYRGTSNTREKPALQGELDYTDPGGFYAGVWGSTIDLSDDDHAHVEIDGYVGYIHVYEKWTNNFRFTYFYYPGAHVDYDYDYFEFGDSITYDFGVPKLTFSLNYSPNYFAESGDALYYESSVEVPLGHNFSLSGHVGYQYLQKEERYGYPSYTNWGVDIAYEWNSYTALLQYIDTDVSENDCPKDCGATLVFSIAYNF